MEKSIKDTQKRKRQKEFCNAIIANFTTGPSEDRKHNLEVNRNFENIISPQESLKENTNIKQNYAIIFFKMVFANTKIFASLLMGRMNLQILEVLLKSKNHAFNTISWVPVI